MSTISSVLHMNIQIEEQSTALHICVYILTEIRPVRCNLRTDGPINIDGGTILKLMARALFPWFF